MKELTKTKRISVSMVGYIAIVLIGVISLSKPSLFFTVEHAQLIEEIENMEFEVFPDEALEYIGDKESNIIFVDIRNEYLYTKSHLEGAVNIPLNDVLDKQNQKFFRDAQKDSSIVILYASNQLLANDAWMILYQLGFNNTKVLLGGYNVIADPNFDPDNMAAYLVEEAAYDYREIVEEAANKQETQVIEEIQAPIQIIPVQRVEEEIDEGGC